MAVTTPWAALVRLIANGEPVEAGVTNRPTSDVTQRTQYLKEVVDSLVAGQLLIIRDVALTSSSVVGMPVYLNAGVYTEALAALGQAQAGGLADPQAFVQGVVVNKSTSTLGDVGISGRIQTAGLTSWNALFDGGVATVGPVYLSAQTAGHFSTASSSLAINLGYLDSAGSLLLNIQAPYLGQHTHYLFNLVGNPAGTVVDPSVGGTHSVNTPNSALSGWLPANATYFPGFVVGNQIPTGAFFGYNLQHSSAAALRAVFPPLPAANASFLQAGVELPGTTVVCNAFGIWWLQNGYGQAPWPTDYNANGGALTIELNFAKYDAASSIPAVTHLSSDPTSLVEIQVLNDVTGSPQNIGSLMLRIATLLQAGVATSEATTALKSFTGNTLVSGPVTVRVFQGAGAIVSGTAGDAINGWYGNLTVGLSTSEALQGYGDLTALNGAIAGFFNDFPVTTLAAGLDSSPVWQLRLSASAPTLSAVNVSIMFTGNTPGALPGGLDWRYKVVIPDAAGTPIPAAWSAASTIVGTILASNAKLLPLGAITGVPRGALVLIQIRRVGSTDGFAGTVALQGVPFTLT